MPQFVVTWSKTSTKAEQKQSHISGGETTNASFWLSDVRFINLWKHKYNRSHLTSKIRERREKPFPHVMHERCYLFYTLLNSLADQKWKSLLDSNFYTTKYLKSESMTETFYCHRRVWSWRVQLRCVSLWFEFRLIDWRMKWHLPLGRLKQLKIAWFFSFTILDLTPNRHFYS